MSPKKIICQSYINLFYRLTILFTSFFIFMTNSPGDVWGANVYIDPTYSGTELGTFNNPYNSWKDFTINSSNDYRQKCGTTYTGVLPITNNGSIGNRIIIGAYNVDGSHEDGGSEVFGAKCSGGSAKPIIDDPNNTGSAMDIDASYIELNSIHVKDGDTTIYSDGDYNVIKYCEVSGGRGGIRAGLKFSSDNIYIGYNYIHTDWGHDPVLDDLDGIQFGRHVDYSIAEYNVIDGYAHAGIRTSSLNCANNEIRYNKIASHDDYMDTCMVINGTYNNFHHNYCDDTGSIQIRSGSNNALYYNIIDGFSSNPYDSSNARIGLIPLGANDCTDNKIYNNVIYDRRNGDPHGSGNPACIQLYVYKIGYGIVERNEIYNNICLNIDSTLVPIYVLDPYDKIESNPSDPDVNVFRNNLVYGWKSKYVAYIEGNYYKYITDQAPPATYFNSYGAAYDNLDSDPSLKDPVNGKFWPNSASASVVGAGYSLGISYDGVLDPDITDFTVSPPLVKTIDQPAKWYIGAFVSGMNQVKRINQVNRFQISQ